MKMGRSLDIIQADLEAAENELREVTAKRNALRQEKQDAVNEASGVHGHVLEYAESRGWGSKRKTITKRLLVEKVEPSWRYAGGLEAHGRQVIASGAVGVMRGRCLIKDLGPYVEPA